MLRTVKWVKKISYGGVFDLAVEQPQLFRKLSKNKNKKQNAHLCIEHTLPLPNQKCMYGAAMAISGNHCLYMVIFGMPLEPYYFELVIVGLR